MLKMVKIQTEENGYMEREEGQGDLHKGLSTSVTRLRVRNGKFSSYLPIKFS